MIIMDIHNSIIDIYNWIMDIHNGKRLNMDVTNMYYGCSWQL